MKIESILKEKDLLLVEDDEILKNNMSISLRTIVKSVTAVSDGKEALKLVNTKSFDIIITDINIPAISGIDLVQILREKHNDMPIIMITSFSSKENLLKIIPLNLIGLLEKPFTFRQLNEILHTTILKTNKSLQDNYYFNEDKYYSFLTKEIFFNNDLYSLTKNEKNLLELFIKNKNQLLEKEFIENTLFPKTSKNNSIKNLVYRLRKKYDITNIETIKDLGYIFKTI